MKHSDLIQIIRRQHLPRLVFPLIMIIVSVVFIISNPFKKALTPHTVDSLDAIEMNSLDDVQQEEKVDEKQESKSDVETEIEAKEELDAPKDRR